jgi:hypothetical protein
MFDLPAATIVYKYCLDMGIRIHLVSRDAVPDLPMSLAQESALMNPQCPVLAYLYNSQKMGLVGLWRNVCHSSDRRVRHTGRAASSSASDSATGPALASECVLPARCTKQWFFTTFCGFTPQEFEDRGFDAMGTDGDIEPWLQGTVKPYDLVSFMTLLSMARQIFDFKKARVMVNDQEGTPTAHYFFVRKDQAPDPSKVEDFLRDAFDGMNGNGRGTPASALASVGPQKMGSRYLSTNTGKNGKARLRP